MANVSLSLRKQAAERENQREARQVSGRGIQLLVPRLRGLGYFTFGQVTAKSSDTWGIATGHLFSIRIFNFISLRGSAGICHIKRPAQQLWQLTFDNEATLSFSVTLEADNYEGHFFFSVIISNKFILIDIIIFYIIIIIIFISIIISILY